MESIYLDTQSSELTEGLQLILLKVETSDKAIDAHSDLGRIALLTAVEYQSLRTVKRLHSMGADLTKYAFRMNRTPLQLAAEVGNLDILNYLLQQGVHHDKERLLQTQKPSHWSA